MKIFFIFIVGFVLINVLEQHRTKSPLVEVKGNAWTEIQKPGKTILELGEEWCTNKFESDVLVMLSAVVCPEGSKCGKPKCTTKFCTSDVHVPWRCMSEIPSKPIGKGSVFPDEKGKEPIEKKDPNPCCFRYGFGAYMVPCCLNLISCDEHDELENNGTLNVEDGGAMGKHHFCPNDAAHAHQLVSAKVAENCWWKGTSPFCDPGECESGSKQVFMDNRGDGVVCLKGLKRKCCKLAGNPNGHGGGAGEGGGSGEPEEPEDPEETEDPEENGGDEDNEEDNPIGDNDYGYPL